MAASGRVVKLPSGLSSALPPAADRASRQAGMDRLAVREVGVAGVGGLPGDGPAAGLLADSVGAVAGHQHVGGGLERQDAAVVLQQHQRLAHRLAGEGAVLGGSEAVELAVHRAVGLEQPGLDLDPQDAADGVVQAGKRDLARAGLGQGVGVEALPAVRGHEHVEAGVEGLRAAHVGAALDLLVAVPVADQEAGEAHPALEHVGEQARVAVVLEAVPARVGGHHGEDAGVDRRADSPARGSRSAPSR